MHTHIYNFKTNSLTIGGDFGTLFHPLKKTRIKFVGCIILAEYIILLFDTTLQKLPRVCKDGVFKIAKHITNIYAL